MTTLYLSPFVHRNSREEENLMYQPPRWRFPVGTEVQGVWRSHSESIHDSLKMEDLPNSVSMG